MSALLGEGSITRAARHEWTRRYAKALLALGGVYEIFVVATAHLRGFGLADGAVTLLYAGLAVAVVSKARPGWLAAYVLTAFAIAAVVRLMTTGFMGSATIVLCTLPVLAAVFASTRAAYAAMGGGLLAYATAGAMRVHGGILPPVDKELLDASLIANWLGIAILFATVVGPTVWLAGRLMIELDAALRDLERARARLAAQVHLRVAAEEDLRAAVDRRERARHRDAEGLVIGGVVHDLRNVFSVLRLWSGTLRTESTLDPEILETCVRVDQACEEATNMAEGFLALARPPPSVRTGAVGPAVEGAAAVLRQALPADVTFVGESDEAAVVAFDPALLRSVIVALSASARWDGLSRIGIAARKPRGDELAVLPGAGAVVELAFEGNRPLESLDPELAEEVTGQGGTLVVDPEDGRSNRRRICLLLASAQGTGESASRRAGEVPA
jgi:signal transduction histidine kinase